MPKIKQLSSHEAQKIAAGEVIERPANIVKELIENSIDAGATRITIYVEDGGKQLIRVVDNGCGMDITDAQKCFDRHATSKIMHVSELENIDTFGFRGEALASIASISKITLLTKEEESLEGTQVIMQANSIESINSYACATGTDISIADLFFNVPARKKFLKTTQTEWRAIQLLFNAFCFDYPHLHFSLFSEGKLVHNCPPATDLKNRAFQLFEPVTHQHLLEISVNEGISLHAVISDHQQYRYDRSSLYFFVNKRWVKNHHLGSALSKGYANVIPNGRYPIGIIHITVPAHEVDINIHPRKEEVKFLHPRRIEQILQQAVKAALEKNISKQLKSNTAIKSVEPKFGFDPFDFDATWKKFPDKPFDTPPMEALRANGVDNSFQQKMDPVITQENFPLPFALPDRRSFSEVGSGRHNEVTADVSKEMNINTKTSHSTSQTTNQEIAQSEISSAHIENYRLIGQYNNTYLLIEKEDGLFLVDQHAAHERILYELFSQRFNEIPTIQLLFPQIITLSTQDIEIILPHLDMFAQHGIIIEQCASDQLIVQSLPVCLKNESIADIIKETIATLSTESDTDLKNVNHKLQAQMACKAAVKAGDTLTQEKMQQLLRDLEKTNNRFSCPHGRPTGWLLSLAEIEKKFRRRI